MFSNQILRGLLMTLAVILIPSSASAAVIFSDTFTDNTKINTSATSARHNSASGQIEAPKQSSANAIALAEYGDEYAVVNGDSVEFYAFDGSSSMLNISSLTIPITNPLGVTMRSDARSLWVYTDTDIKRYDFDGGGMSYNPSLSVLGISGVVSISSQPNSNGLTVLVDDGSGNKKVKQYSDNGTGVLVENLALEKAITITNPLSVSAVPNSFDFVVAGETESKYYAYDPALGSYLENPYLSVLSLSNATAFTQNTSIATSIEGSEVKRYTYDGSSMSAVVPLSKTITDTAVSVASKSSSYDFAYVTDTGTLKYFTFNGTEMVENTAKGTTSLTLNSGYLNGKVYQSIAFASASYGQVRLTTTESNDPSTSIAYFVSSNGGVSWTPVVTNSWQIVPAGTQFVVRATLTTSDPTSTPRLQSVQLEAQEADLDPPTLTLINPTKYVFSDNNYLNLVFTSTDASGIPTISYRTYLSTDMSTPLVGTSLSSDSAITGTKILFGTKSSPSIVNGSTYVVRLTSTDAVGNVATADIKVRMNDDGTVSTSSIP